MADRDESRAPGDAFEPHEQTPALIELLKTLDVAGKSLALYGSEHSISVEHLSACTSAVAEFLAASRRATCIFGKDSLIVNENAYLPSEISQDLARKLKARGVMAITFAGQPSDQELLEYLMFLNAEPHDIRLEGGPSDYLRRRGVSRIVATEAVYVSDDADEQAPAPRDPALPNDVDRAIAYAIDWLSKQESEDEAPRLPIADILSRPDMAAKLIREAVTKLHASRREYTDNELATEVVHDLKDLADSDPDTWDNATPQIRKAIAKLPKEMLPAASGFTDDQDDADAAQRTTASVAEIEADVAGILADTVDAGALPAPERFDSLFGARADGLPSNWRAELQPDLVIRSSGRTLSTLMAWESNASEYCRIAGALAALIPRAVEMNDIGSALEFAESLLAECAREDGVEWRVSAARSALQNLDPAAMIALIESAMRIGGRREEDVCAGLLTTVRGLALRLLPMLEAYDGSPFGRALRRGVTESRQAALGPLAEMLRTGSPRCRIAALELLADISGAAAASELANVVNGADEILAVRALGVLPRVRVPAVVDICVGALNHTSAEVREAAVETLGLLDMDDAFESLMRLARRRSLRGGDAPEKLAAVTALERSGRPEAIECLEAMARYSPLFGRSHYDAVRKSARRAAAALRERLNQSRPEAA